MCQMHGFLSSAGEVFFWSKDMHSAGLSSLCVMLIYSGISVFFFCVAIKLCAKRYESRSLCVLIVLIVVLCKDFFAQFVCLSKLFTSLSKYDELVVNGRTTLNIIFKRLRGLDSSSSVRGSMTGSFEHCNENSSTTKAENLLISRRTVSFS
jgi:hypothetical protein